ncbi:VOC family protein [Streptomyces sp. NRRL S-237]|uniref:VOC family protein n=1 Tax=Streptomyces sp. NRRL S-237 TaxID=1463895 RepID=UPI0004C6DCCE|nr:VOC family protein [Streptomyces sp. NRRL S-237]
MAKEFQVTYDCADPGAQALFWAEALGYRVQPPPEGFPDWPAALTAWGVPPEQHNSRSAITDPDGKGPRVFFQKVPEGKTSKNRLHLDVRAAPSLKGDARMAKLEEEATRLEALGAKRLYRIEGNDMDEGIIVMADPEGNEFCLD